ATSISTANTTAATPTAPRCRTGNSRFISTIHSTAGNAIFSSKVSVVSIAPQTSGKHIDRYDGGGVNERVIHSTAPVVPAAWLRPDHSERRHDLLWFTQVGHPVPLPHD